MHVYVSEWGVYVGTHASCTCCCHAEYRKGSNIVCVGWVGALKCWVRLGTGESSYLKVCVRSSSILDSHPISADDLEFILWRSGNRYDRKPGWERELCPDLPSQ